MALPCIRPVPKPRAAPERAFLPAALEVLETPPSPLGRALGWSIMSVVVAVVLWASLGRVDTVAVAAGRVVPGGSVKRVQPLETGVVREVHVREGERVALGQALLSLDDTVSAADLERVGGELAEARLEILRLHALARGERELPAPAFPHEASSLTAQRQLLRGMLRERAAALARLDERLRETAASREVLAVQVASLDAGLPLLAERTTALRTLADARVAARTDYLALAQQLVELRHARKSAVRRGMELEARAAALAAERETLRGGFARETQEHLIAAERRVRALRAELRKARRRQELRVLRAPAAGTVQQLAVRSVGAVVKPAEPVLVVVPDGVPLEVEASLSSRDAGFVSAGQPVEVKVDSFPFTRYGLLNGHVQQVAADAVRGEDGLLRFPARIVLGADEFLIDGERRRISPGMGVSAEIRTGERRLMDFFLSPVMRYGHEALRER